jgi:hypothetical protein
LPAAICSTAAPRCVNDITMCQRQSTAKYGRLLHVKEGLPTLQQG